MNVFKSIFRKRKEKVSCVVTDEEIRNELLEHLRFLMKEVDHSQVTIHRAHETLSHLVNK